MYICTYICCTGNEKEAMNLKESKDGRIWIEERVGENGVIIISKIKRSNFFKDRLFWLSFGNQPIVLSL